MTPEIEAMEKQIEELKERLAQARREAPREEVSDFAFQTLAGPVKLSELFGDKDDLLVVHNMGKSCPYCTLWADGINGHLRHYEERTALVVVNGNPPEIQDAFAKGRGWKFRMANDPDKSFTAAMGYWNERDGWWPGVSGFTKIGGKIYRTGKAVFGPGDDYCPIWPMMDLIGGDKGWEPSV
ncbi:MAG: DUF899 family protein [Armatimonadetes bacterium]|nr:DUF899 family protein [Armatimonadota bacterium]